MDDLTTKIETYKKQEQTLRFDHFSNEDALALGLMLVEKGKTDKLPIAIDITVNGYQIFWYAFEGTSIGNRDYIRRKANMVNWKKQSSIHVGAQLQKDGTSLAEKHHVSLEDYVDIGGGFPIWVNGTGFIGTICISGLPHEQDHQTIVDVLSEFLKK